MIERFLSTYKDGFEVMLNPEERDEIVEEIERLNNIINEFEKFLFGELQTYGGGGTAQEYYDKLQELKGEDKE